MAIISGDEPQQVGVLGTSGRPFPLTVRASGAPSAFTSSLADMGIASAATSSATAASVEFDGALIDANSARQLPLYGNALLFVFGVCIAAMFVFATCNIVRSARILPRWFTLGGLVVGVFMLLSATFTPLLVLAFPMWLIVLCGLLFQRAQRLPG